MVDPAKLKPLSNLISRNMSTESEGGAGTQDKATGKPDTEQRDDQPGRDAATSWDSTSANVDMSFLRKEKEEDTYITDPDFNKEFVDATDRAVKLMLMAIMFLSTLIWGVFFYSWFHLPSKIFAHREIRNLFLPYNYWSGIYWQIACPWFAGLYGLVVVVYPDPRRWRYCFRPRRTWRWVPYILPFLYTVIVNAYWVYSLCLIPDNLRNRMRRLIDKSLNRLTTSFPVTWEYVHNYYQCCGIESKTDWSNKIIPKREIPYPFKNDSSCTTFYYGYNNSSRNMNCSLGNYSALGILWPASCCNNDTLGCVTLPTNSQTWRGNCHVSEMALGIGTVIAAIVLSIVVDILGVLVFLKARVLESVALREKLKPPKPHF